MKKLLLSVLFLAFLLSGTEHSLLYAQKPVLQFQKDKDFKIAHFTDLHLKAKQPAESKKTFARMDNIVATEHPDFIVITGDVVTGKEDAREMWKEVISHLDENKIPWAVVYGNHDAEQNIPRPEMSAMIAAGKYSVNTLNAKGELADMRVPVIASSASAKKVKPNTPAPLDLYLFDSNDYSTDSRIGGYGWITPEQIEWYRQTSSQVNDTTSSSLAFFHIPLREYQEAWDIASARYHDRRKGIRGEDECAPRINTGLFSAMLASKSMMGVFCGHDHNNDYLVSYYGIALAYGRFSGDNTTYSNLRHGVRIISVHEGEHAFRTWIHEDDNAITYRLRYSDGKINDK